MLASWDPAQKVQWLQLDGVFVPRQDGRSVCDLLGWSDHRENKIKWNKKTETRAGTSAAKLSGPEKRDEMIFKRHKDECSSLWNLNNMLDDDLQMFQLPSNEAPLRRFMVQRPRFPK